MLIGGDRWRSIRWVLMERFNPVIKENLDKSAVEVRRVSFCVAKNCICIKDDGLLSNQQRKFVFASIYKHVRVICG